MASPPGPKKAPTRGFLGGLFRRRNRSWSNFREGSSRRGRRYLDGDPSVGRDSSTHSTALFDLELSHRGFHTTLETTLPSLTSPSSATAAPTDSVPALSSRAQAALSRIIYLSQPTASFEVQLLQHVCDLREANCGPGGELDLVDLVVDLARMGYSCHVQRNDPMDPSQQAAQSAASAVGVDRNCLEKLRHEFIVCTGRLDGSAAHYCLVDPTFRDQFAIGQPTAEYDVLLNAVPREFAGSPLRLQALVNVLCAEVSAVYEGQRLPLPPWRRTAAVLGRWFDVGATAAAAAAKLRQQQFEAEQKKEQHHASITEGRQGGTAHFHATVAMHQASIKVQRHHQDPFGMQRADTSLDDRERSNKPRRMQRQRVESAETQSEEHRRAATVEHTGGEDQDQDQGSPRRSVPNWSELSTILEASSLRSSSRFGKSASSCAISSSSGGTGSQSDLAQGGSGHRCAGSSAKGERHIGTPPPLGGASLAERRGRDNISSGKSSAALTAAAAAAAGGGYVAQPPPQTTVADSRTSNRGGKAVSMLARRLKMMGQRDTWSGKLDGGLR